jgi:hypothetical protein
MIIISFLEMSAFYPPFRDISTYSSDTIGLNLYEKIINEIKNLDKIQFINVNKRIDIATKLKENYLLN